MDAEAIRCVAVIGAGTMGHGIAQEFAVAGYDVRLQSRNDASLRRAMANIQSNLSRLVKLGRITSEEATLAPSNISETTSLKDAIRDVDIVIESVYEDLALKQQIFGELDRMCADDVVLASNTSTFMPSHISARTASPERVVVAHYINPPYLVPLVEIVSSDETSDATVETLTDILKLIGKRPVVVRQEVPGFIASRLQAALLREALWLVENGVASPEDVDVTIKSSLGRRWAVAGVFEVLELAGWDLLAAVASQLFPHLSTSEAPLLLDEKVERGEIGVKSGRGFYEWTPELEEELKSRIARALVEIECWDKQI